MAERKVTSARGVLCAAFVLAGCTARPGPDIGVATGESAAPDEGDGGGAGCLVDGALPGTPYDISKSRFAFGSTPVAVDAGSLVRFTGADGVVAIFRDGSELASLDAGAPEQNLPDWSADPSALTAHVRAYFESMGLADCQVGAAQVFGGAEGGGSAGGSTFIMATSNTVLLARGVDGVPVVESTASARMTVDDQSTSEGFYWPTIPASVATAAIAFRDRLADPAALTAYKALLPADAQGQGQVVIHHTSAASPSPFASATTYDVVAEAGSLGFASILSFDATGNPVQNNW
ncbi:MAG TPA: hypothetical protein VGM06_16320 [Polyangiaceae bacterium]|jgi:hypothetical protein